MVRASAAWTTPRSPRRTASSPRAAACSSSTTTGATTCPRSAIRTPRSTAIWSRREGPFLRGGGFKIRVLHCFWTFESLEDTRAFLEEAFGERGVAVAAGLRRPRLSWNVAVYHRWRGGVAPPDAPGDPA